MITLLFSLLAWGFLFRYAHNHPIKNVHFKLRGGGGGDKEGAEQGIQEAGETAYQRGKMTPEEESQYKGSFNLGDIIQQILQYQMGVGEAPSGYLDPTQAFLKEGGELGQTLYGQTLQEAKDPYAYYESTLQPQLQLTQDAINREYQNRGLIRSGLGIEAMGRAGVELAIKEAEARMNARNQALQRAAGLTEYIGGQQQNRLTNLSNLYSGQQQYGLNALGRQAGQAQAAAQYQAYPYQASLGSYYGGQAAQQALPGQLIGAAGTAAGSYLGKPVTNTYIYQ